MGPSLVQLVLALATCCCCLSTNPLTAHPLHGPTTTVQVTAEPPTLIGARSGSRLYFPLLQHTLPAGVGENAGPIMLRAQTSPDAEGSPTQPNTDAVFVTANHGASWIHVADEPVQKRMCYAYPLSAGAAPALRSIGASLADVQPVGTLCVPYAYHPPAGSDADPHATRACQLKLNDFCNSEALNGPVCIDPQTKEYGRKMSPYTALFDVGMGNTGAAWRCYSHEALNANGTAWSSQSKTPAAYCSGSGPGLERIYDSCPDQPLVQMQPARRNGSLWVVLANGTVAKTRGDSVKVTFAASRPMHVAGCALRSQDGKKLLTALYQETAGPDYILLYEASPPFTNWSVRARVTPLGEVGNENCARPPRRTT